MVFSSYFFIKDSDFDSAFLNNFIKSSGYVDSEPIKYIWIILGNSWKNLLLEYLPLIDLYIN